jgi:hypothetical protein
MDTVRRDIITTRSRRALAEKDMHRTMSSDVSHAFVTERRQVDARQQRFSLPEQHWSERQM